MGIQYTILTDASPVVFSPFASSITSSLTRAASMIDEAISDSPAVVKADERNAEILGDAFLTKKA